MKKNIYRDTMHELVAPILIDTPTDPEKRKKMASQLRKSAKQELKWAASADLEGRAERSRALKLPNGDPLRSELLADSRIAYGFGKLRIDRANKLRQLADNLSKSLVKPKKKTVIKKRSK